MKFIGDCAMLFESVEKSAVFSECGRYRYRLKRSWDSSLPIAAWVMLNPSTADASVDDNTIMRCMSFAKRWGCGGIDVANLYSLVSTDPGGLSNVDDPVGPETGAHLREIIGSAFVVAAWGRHADKFRAASFVQLAREAGVEVKCLGKNSDGSPKHPLYLPSQKALEAYP